MSVSGPVTLRARYVFPVDRPPIPGGLVTIVGGRIASVGPNPAGQRVLDLGNVALLPGLVNAHTHLEFSDLPQPIGQPGMQFPQWLAQVVARRRAQPAEPAELLRRRTVAVAQGWSECCSHGTALVGDIGTPPLITYPTVAPPADVAAFETSPQAPGWPSSTVFLELLGLADERIEPLLQLARTHLSAEPAGWRAGLSPHAPYTVQPRLLAEVCRLSAEFGAPVAMHLAESFEELELLASASGPLVELLKSLDAWYPAAIPRGIRPLEYLELLAGAHRALVIHGNFLGRDEHQYLASQRDKLAVVYCPRTQAYFAHGAYPLAEMLAAGVNVAVGTDSRASNPDLNLLTELRHVYAFHPDVSPADILRLGTLNGARALGIAAECGAISAGRAANLAVVQLPDANSEDPYELLFAEDTPVWPVGPH